MSSKPSLPIKANHFSGDTQCPKHTDYLDSQDSCHSADMGDDKQYIRDCRKRFELGTTKAHAEKYYQHNFLNGRICDNLSIHDDYEKENLGEDKLYWKVPFAKNGHSAKQLRSPTSDSDSEDYQYTDEPHKTRRLEILKKHPEIKQLMGHDSRIAYIITAEVLVQVVVSWLVHQSSWTLVLVMSYCVSTALNHSLAVAIHEAGHNLVFGLQRPWLNRAVGVWANLPLGVPLAITFKKYHSDHHRYLGDYLADTDVPFRWERLFFHHPVTKVLWMLLHPLIYAVRPFFKTCKPLGAWEIMNLTIQLAFNYLIYAMWGGKALLYLIMGLAFGFSLHPLAAHFISEHYFLKGGLPTHSYYGPLNAVLFNAGYHNEHHDFPYIPYLRLPQVTQMAPEFYNCLPSNPSYVKVMWDFIMNTHMAPHASGMNGLEPSA